MKRERFRIRAEQLREEPLEGYVVDVRVGVEEFEVDIDETLLASRAAMRT